MEKASIEEIRIVLKYISKGYSVPKIIYQTILDTARREIEDKERVVIIKRDPDISREHIQAMYAKIIESGEETYDYVIQVHPATTPSFNADFDGDTYAVYVPLSEETQKEAKQKMMVTTTTSSINSPNFILTKEMLTALFTMTSREKGKSKTIKKPEDAIGLNIDQKVIITFKGKQETTAGRVIFNNILPKWYPYINESIDKKKLNGIFSDIIAKDKTEFVRVIDDLMRLAFHYGTIYAKSFIIEDMELSSELIKLKNDLSESNDPAEQSQIINEMEKELLIHLKKNIPQLYDQIASGAARGINQLRQVMVCKGLISDPSGNILPPITTSLTEGYDPKEYFEASAGSRTGIINRSINTAVGGYSYRKMVYIMGNIELNTIKNCLTKRGLEFRLTKGIFDRLSGRYVIVDGDKVIKINEEMIGEKIKLRSPALCKTNKICHICYGDLAKQNATKNIGLVAAQNMNISERIMKCADGLVNYDNKYYAMEDLWQKFYDKSCDESIDLNIKISGKNSDVNTIHMNKHKPNDSVLFISTKSGHTLVCQSNHPLWIKKNPLSEKYENKNCRLVGNQKYMTTGSGISQHFNLKDEELIKIEAKNLKKYDVIWIDNTFPMNNCGELDPEINAYLVGMYVGDGNKLHYDHNGKKGFQISQFDNKYKEKLLENSSDFKNIVYPTYIIYKDPDSKLFEIVKGRYSYQKRLEPNFINYSKSWLRKFLSGLIDSDGTVFGGLVDNVGTCCRIYTSSYYLVQQLKMICLKLGYRMNTCLVPGNNNYSKAQRQSRRHFTCDIRFHDSSIPPLDSIKLVKKGIVSIKGNYKNEFPQKGFDIITLVKDMDNWNYSLYDIQTESKEFLLGCVQNHNSFHLGGVISLEPFDIINDIISNLDELLLEKIKKFFYQEKDTLFLSLDSAMITLDKRMYESLPFERERNQIRLPVGYFELHVQELIIPITIEEETILNLSDDIEEDKQYLHVHYHNNDALFTVEPKVRDYTKLARKLDAIIGGKDPWFEDVNILYIKFMKRFVLIENYDSVHIEILLSNILRWTKDPSIPARLKTPYNPKLFSVKKLPGLISWQMGLAFENFGNAVATGLISPRQPPSPIEKIMMGESLVEDKK